VFDSGTTAGELLIVVDPWALVQLVIFGGQKAHCLTPSEFRNFRICFP